MPLPRLRPPSRDRRRPAPSGAPLALPPVLDRVAEQWWATPPRVRAGVAVALVVVALAVVGRGAAASPWGPPRPVLVAASDLPAGRPLTPDAARSTTWPAALVPDDALVADDLTGDARMAGPTPAGSVLTRRHVASGLAGLVAEGHAAVAVPLDGLPRVRAGDLVDVVAASPDGAGRRIANAARVLSLEDGFLWLGVATDQVDAVAAAGAAGRLTLAVRPARPPP